MWDGGPYWSGDPFAYDDPYGDYSDRSDGDYPVGQAPAGPSFLSAQQTIIAVQRALTQLGYYHGPIDGVAGPQTQKAIRWFQSADKLPLTGQIDGPTLKVLRAG